MQSKYSDNYNRFIFPSIFNPEINEIYVIFLLVKISQESTPHRYLIVLVIDACFCLGLFCLFLCFTSTL